MRNYFILANFLYLCGLVTVFVWFSSASSDASRANIALGGTIFLAVISVWVAASLGSCTFVSGLSSRVRGFVWVGVYHVICVFI